MSGPAPTTCAERHFSAGTQGPARAQNTEARTGIDRGGQSMVCAAATTPHTNNPEALAMVPHLKIKAKRRSNRSMAAFSAFSPGCEAWAPPPRRKPAHPTSHPDKQTSSARPRTTLTFVSTVLIRSGRLSRTAPMPPRERAPRSAVCCWPVPMASVPPWLS